ncbi:uncharacterized protein [Rutidosis leptorrhynchoides]|uniref:uncharacterized protein n=1 Tax=Rutidosis leptorrhynchoides TaxID=125765 RepID=UPI003A99697F
MEDIDYGWGIGSIITMLIVVACMVFIPVVMGPVGPPSFPVIVLIPVLLVAIIIFMSIASNPNHGSHKFN